MLKNLIETGRYNILSTEEIGHLNNNVLKNEQKEVLREKFFKSFFAYAKDNKKNLRENDVSNLCILITDCSDQQTRQRACVMLKEHSQGMSKKHKEQLESCLKKEMSTIDHCIKGVLDILPTITFKKNEVEVFA